MKTKNIKPTDGWICTHYQYGTWFISREAVANDWKKDHRSYYKDDKTEANREPSREEIDTWFREQISWIEINRFGKQTRRPNMELIEKQWLKSMKEDPDWAENTKQIGVKSKS